MTAVAAFDVLTDVNPETVKSNLIQLWVWKQVNILVNPETKLTSCILEYIFYQPEEEKSIRDIVDYLLNISKEGWIYYYPCWDVYSNDEGDEDVEISVDDIFTEEYEPSLGGEHPGMRFLIRKH